jgi:hypothetical protein
MSISQLSFGLKVVTTLTRQTQVIYMWARAFPMGLPKAKINSNITHKPKKWLLIDEFHVRQNGNLLQFQAIYALHCLFAISFFYYFVF